LPSSSLEFAGLSIKARGVRGCVALLLKLQSTSFKVQ
jgi:hypothetical protein